jgi:LPS-assembly protein
VRYFFDPSFLFRAPVQFWSHSLPWSALALIGFSAWAQPALPVLPGPQAGPTTLEAEKIRGTPNKETMAEGHAELKRDATRIRADKLTYDQTTDMAQALGNVVIQKNQDTFKGPFLQLKLSTYEGFFLNPGYHLGRSGATGSAERIDFLDADRTVGHQASYSTCTPDDLGHLDWVITAKRLTVDQSQNEAVAEGAVLRFLGVPILAAPLISFPLGKERKTGWLPPSLEIDSRNGLQVSAPFYWNIAPNRDATVAPELIARRGGGINSEFRYLESDYQGAFKLNWLPFDKLANQSRYGLNLQHMAAPGNPYQINLQVMRVSDDSYWKDFAKGVGSLTPRLLSTHLDAQQDFSGWTTYARIQNWQVLQSSVAGEGIESPYQREPQLGARTQRLWNNGLRLDIEGEFNRFTTPAGASHRSLPTGTRLHSLASLSWTRQSPAWTLTPKLSLNAAAYSMDTPLRSGGNAGQRSLSRLIPTSSIDSQWVLERETRWFDAAIRQTLEPRLVYSYTPYKNQSGWPNFDSAAKDFNFDSIQSAESQFTGIDRVADAHQVTGSLHTRLILPENGTELLRFGLAQRYLLKDQRITPDGILLTQRISDLFFTGGTSIIPHWLLNTSAQYSPEISRIQRSSVAVTFKPGPLRLLTLAHSLDRVGLTEQITWAWQWPVYGPANSTAPPLIKASPEGSSGSCRGTWYSVGRVNYNPRESRVVDSLAGLEYDAGCWVARVVARRQSTGLNESITGVGIQLELVGLSRLGFGANPVQVLKDNVGGYQALRN